MADVGAELPTRPTPEQMPASDRSARILGGAELSPDIHDPYDPAHNPGVAAGIKKE